MEHPLSAYGRGTVWHLLRHYVLLEKPIEIPLFLAKTPVVEEDYVLAERLIDSFFLMKQFETKDLDIREVPNEGIWKMIEHEFHGEAYGLLFDKNVRGLAHYLSEAFRRSVSCGLGPGPVVYSAMSNVGSADQYDNVLILQDRVCSMAEALGVLTYENPEQGRYGVNIGMPPREIVKMVEERLGYQIDRPRVMGIFGLEIDGRVIDFRVPDDTYCTYRLKQLCDQFGLNSVAEIGGGFGGMALQMFRAGIQSICMFDLPLMCIIQGYFLMKTVGSDYVGLFGDAQDFKIRVLPYWEFFSTSYKCDIVFNRDSLPEIPIAHAEKYLDGISQNKTLFLSVNQESGAAGGRADLNQLNINQLARKKGFILMPRHPYWIRKGYLEELYAPPL